MQIHSRSKPVFENTYMQIHSRSKAPYMQIRSRSKHSFVDLMENEGCHHLCPVLVLMHNSYGAVILQTSHLINDVIEDEIEIMLI